MQHTPDVVTSHTPQWYTHSYNRFTFYRLVAACAPWLPRPVRLRLASSIATCVRHWMPRENAAVQRNLARILPALRAPDLETQACALFRNFACFFTDLLSLNRAPLVLQQRYIHAVHGLEHLHAALASPRGFIAATAHLGNWDLAGRLLSTYGRTLHVIMAAEHDGALHNWLRQHREQPALRFVTNTQPTVLVQLLTALRRGEMVAVQVDRATGHRSDMRVPFFGAPASFPLGPFTLASAAQVPVLPCFCLMRPDQQYDIFVEEAIPVSRGHEETALRQMVAVLERYVLMAPDQWCNFYDIWDTRLSA
ncbi:MAG: lysophospholipid acyltransferase family protein [Candidatus Tectimicrobiota bacterium]